MRSWRTPGSPEDEPRHGLVDWPSRGRLDRLGRIPLILGAVAAAVYVSMQDISAANLAFSYAVLAFVALTNAAVIVFPRLPSLTFSIGVPLLMAGIATWMWIGGTAPGAGEWAAIVALYYMAAMFGIHTVSGEVSKRREPPLALLYLEVASLVGAVLLVTAALICFALLLSGIVEPPF